MKTGKMLTILILGLMFCLAEVCEAAPMGSAFTYQGRLIDANKPADGLYDFQFKLFDDANTVTGDQVGSDFNTPDVDVIDGYFTVELAFGSDVFDGNAVWLEIDVRPGDSNDPNAFITLSPRQEVTPIPYALQTRGIFVDKAENVGLGTTTPTGKLHVDGGQAGTGADGGDIMIEAQDGGDGEGLGGDNGGHGGNIILLSGEGGEPSGFGVPGRPGNVGIGTTTPNYEFDVVGNINFTGNLYQNGSLFSGGGSLWTENGSDIYFNTGNVGIGTANPGATLDVRGNIKVDQKIQAYDSGGLELATDEGSTRLYIPDSGHVGIGGMTPSFPFHVKKWYDTGWISGIHNLGTAVQAHGLIIRADGGDPLLVQSASIDVLSTKQSGNVGIGTREPSGSLYPESTTLEIAGNAPSIVLDDELGSAQDDFEISNGGDKVLFRDATDGINILSIGLTGDSQGKIDVYSNEIKNYYGFPRPAYDSGWVAVAQNSSMDFDHNLGGNVDNYVVDMQMKSTGGAGINNIYIGANTTGEYWYGAHWSQLTTTSSRVHREIDDNTAGQIRIRIWVYN
jgi:hypothetical protein